MPHPTLRLERTIDILRQNRVYRITYVGGISRNRTGESDPEQLAFGQLITAQRKTRRRQEK